MWRFSVHFESCLNLRPLDGSIVIFSVFTLWTSRHPERWTAMCIVWPCSRQHGAVQPKEWINHRLTSLILISRSIRCVTKNLFFLNRIRPFVTFILQNTPLMFHLAPVQCHTRFVYSRSSFNQPPLLSANQLSSPSKRMDGWSQASKGHVQFPGWTLSVDIWPQLFPFLMYTV